jgi:putative methionine-R-sulfoxide reductase with GAF domain
MAGSGQILVGTTQNVGSHGLKVELPKEIETGLFVTFRFSREKTSIGGDGRVVWSGSSEDKQLCGITFVRMKQRDRQSLDELLEHAVFPRCPVCHSMIDLDQLTRLVKREPCFDGVDHGRDLSSLTKIAGLLRSHRPGKAMEEKTLGVIKNHFHAKAVMLLLYNKETGILELGCQVGWGSAGDLSLAPEGTTAGRAFEEKRAFFVPDVQKDPVFPHKSQAKAVGVRSMVALPLIVEGEPLGVLELFTSVFDKGEIRENDEERLLTFATLVAVAIRLRR